LGQRIASSVFDLGMAPLERRHLRSVRRDLLPRASGSVLEIGAGTGVNLEFYAMDAIDRLTVSDIEPREYVFRRRFDALEGRWGSRRPELAIERIDAHRLPFPDAAFDTVVATLLFCSVECAPCGIDEVRRVLKPGGRYLFLEHVRPSRRYLGRAFDVINPLWRLVSGGCNLNRDTLRSIGDAGFSIARCREVGGVFVYGEATA
jgi:SAM-dependent methyltransferase